MAVVDRGLKFLRHSFGMTWRDHCRKLPIVKNKIFFEAYGGNGLTCSPEAIFRHLATECQDDDYTFVWVVSDKNEYAQDIRRLEKLAPFTVVSRGTLDYHRHLYTSQYLINNMSFPADFVKRAGQIYVNTWHGVPLKKMGYDVPGRIEDGKNIIRNFMHADYLLSSSPADTDRMYLGAFKLQNLFRGTILEEGNPRTDLQRDRESALDELDTEYPHMRFKEDQRKVVLYAPTWRGSQYDNPEDQDDLLLEAVAGIEAGLDLGKYRVVVKVHQAIERTLRKNSSLADRMAPSGANPNRLLAISEMVVTDFSSIFYDFLSTGRPVIHYVPDFERYSEYRDIYDTVQELPGIVVQDRRALTLAVQSATAAAWKPSDAYLHAAKIYAPLDDGGATERVVQVVFQGQRSERARLVAGTDKTRLLIYTGPLNRNGITTSVKNLLSNIDYDRYDVTALVPYSSKDEERRLEWNRLDSRVRVMFRFGNFAGNAYDNWKRIVRSKSHGYSLGKQDSRQRELWRLEWHRLFGDAVFDQLVDFTGYSPFWGSLFLCAPSGHKSVWQHNDLLMDAERTVDGKMPLNTNLTKVFQLYPYFDKIVSVSEELMKINLQKVGTETTRDKFTWVPNTIDVESLRARSEEKVPYSSESTPSFTFVNVARLSPEKNHMRLIAAFDQVQQVISNVRLLILGDGPSRADLEAEVLRRGLADQVYFTGMVENPYPAMRDADCMVISSDYEGQPMVILEAMTLGLPVVTTDFGSVSGSFPAGGAGEVVARDASALAMGMVKACRSGLTSSTFDVGAYNTEAIEKFSNLG